MPRPPKIGGPAPKRRSRNGCWPCKTRKVKCDETKPRCRNCLKQGEICDYSIRLNWEGRGHKKGTSISSVAKDSSPSSLGSESVGSRTLLLHDGSPGLSSQAHDSDGYGQIAGPNFDITSAPNTYAEYMPQVSEATSHSTLEAQNLAFVPAKRPSSEPPFFENSDAAAAVEVSQHGRPHKRIYQDRNIGLRSYVSEMLPPSNSSFHGSYMTQPYYSPPLTSMAHPSSSGNLLTPTSTSTFNDDYQPSLMGSVTSPIPELNDVRRLSINSLLSGTSGAQSLNHPPQTPRSNSDNQDSSIQYQDIYTDHTTYGIDRGIVDLDYGKNDDTNAISQFSSTSGRNNISMILNRDDSPGDLERDVEGQNTFGDGAGYYDNPVPINIPRLLEPLPHLLRENPMNLLYFHHFINHTADALIPHDCSFNPFKLILPQMAVRDSNLLKLLLAYSASHRARLLQQPEPVIRIALWTRGIFSNLRTALDDPSKIVSNESLATATMLASLEIISPKAFGVEIPWQRHLETAREMIAARGGPLKLKSTARGDKVTSFLWSWFAYLDVLGSLSGGGASSLSTAWLDDDVEDEEDFDIDCVLGFTSKCIRLLARVAELGRISDAERARYEVSKTTEPDDWRPSNEVLDHAQQLVDELHASLSRHARPCTHLQSTGEATFQWDSIEMAATNEMFHWAGLVHLHRRIMAKPSTDPDVQNAVGEIFGALNKIRRGSSAEACLLFPMFLAGCESRDEKQRTVILERIKSVEQSGMMQMHQARMLMEKTWITGQPWETLVAGEFFG